ncbi:MAG TPA: helix-turn-helix transcriptional regulator [Actinomycetes bacterium]
MRSWRPSVPAASLRATVADPRQSARYREFLDPMGFTDELRAMLRVGDSPWGAINLPAPAASPPSPGRRSSWWPASRPLWARRSGCAPGRPASWVRPFPVAEVAPIIVQAYDLTDREWQITSLIARGAGTADIAEELFLSAHTVRDHVKAIFAKVGVNSRGELVARLFADHYEPVHLQDVVRQP